jgi:LL-diaminopimelate aminotransferase
MGMTGDHNGTCFDGIQYMACSPDNDFFPDLSKASACA